MQPRKGENEPELLMVSVDHIKPNRFQPRRLFSEEGLQELADSIAANGVLEPLILRPAADGYEVVAGERRLRAARLVGLHTVPAIVRIYSDAQAAEIALIENLQRENLNPIEEASAFARLLQEFGHTQEDLAKRLGRSRSHLANTLRLLQLPPELQEHLVLGRLETGHARALLTLELELQLELAREIIAKNLSVRQTEARVRSLRKTPASPTKPASPSRETTYWENQLVSHLDAKVHIKSARGSNPSGKIEIAFQNPADLERIVELLLATLRDELA